MINCSICNTEFEQKHTNHVTCSNTQCVKTRTRATHTKWRREVLGVKEKNYLSLEDQQIIADNRFLSNKDLGTLINRTTEFIRHKRSRLKLPRQAVCSTCDCIFDRINQHNQCSKCTPNQSETAKNYRNGLNGRWQMYKNNAKKRNLVFELTIKHMADMWQKPCTYCGGKIEIVGIDRIDNSLGYIEGNIVSCCARCNEMKMSATKEDWLSQMEKILKHQGVIK